METDTFNPFHPTMLEFLFSRSPELKHALLSTICAGLVCPAFTFVFFRRFNSLSGMPFNVQPVGATSTPPFRPSPRPSTHSDDGACVSTHLWPLTCYFFNIRCLYFISRDLNRGLPPFTISSARKIPWTGPLQDLETLVRWNRYEWETASVLFRTAPAVWRRR